MKRILTCEPGDQITSKGKKMIVAEVITPGAEDYMRKKKVPGPRKLQKGRRSNISAYPIADNGQVMGRSPRHVGQKWAHLDRHS